MLVLVSAGAESQLKSEEKMIMIQTCLRMDLELGSSLSRQQAARFQCLRSSPDSQVVTNVTNDWKSKNWGEVERSRRFRI